MANRMRVCVGSGHIDFLLSTGYAALTGRPVPGYGSKPVRDGTKVIERIYARTKRYSSVIKKIRANPRMKRLWYGDIDDYQSASEADFAFLHFIAPLLNRDRQLMDELMRESGLYREKWERKDYRERTI